MRILVVPIVLGLMVGACTETQTQRGATGALIGGGLGAATGAIVGGGDVGSAVAGGLIGAAVGGAAGVATAPKEDCYVRNQYGELVRVSC